MATADLFTMRDAPAPAKALESGLLVTNHLNLMYMLAAGLVMPPAGFGDKYYRDTLECFPGWIPLFLDKVPRDAIESSTREAGHLKPIIVRISLPGMSGNLIAFGEHGPRELHFPDQLDGTERMLLVPAPLPTSRIESIVFQTAADKRACERDAKDFGNVPLEDFNRKFGKTLFTKAPDTTWPPGEGPAERAVPLERPLAAGGVMAMLLLFGNLGEQAVRACRNAFDPVGDAAQHADEPPILAGLATWMQEWSRAPFRHPRSPGRIESACRMPCRRGSSGRPWNGWSGGAIPALPAARRPRCSTTSPMHRRAWTRGRRPESRSSMTPSNP